MAEQMNQVGIPAVDLERSAPGAHREIAISSADPLLGELLCGHLRSSGFPAATVVDEVGTAVDPEAAPVVLVPPSTFGQYLGGGWDGRLRSVPLSVPLVVLARPHLPVRDALMLTQRRNGIALLDAGSPSVTTSVASALSISIDGGQMIDPAFIDMFTSSTSGELTPAEYRVYELLANGRSNAGIAHELYVSERTIEVHVRHLFAKLGLTKEDMVNRRVLATLMFHRNAD